MVGQEESSKHLPASPVGTSHNSAAPLWTRVPKGWIILALFILAWVGVFLIWQGVVLFATH